MYLSRLTASLACFLLLFAPAHSGQAADTTEGASSFDRALRIVENYALYLPSKAVIEKSRAMTEPEASLKALLAGVDSYSTYVSSKEATRIKASQTNEYSGVGMDLLQTADGGFLCLPHSEGPAIEGGVRRGDSLVAVDGQKVRGRLLPQLEQLIRGPEGSDVQLEVFTGQEHKVVTLSRRNVTKTSVELLYDPVLPRIQIAYFDAYTPIEIESCLEVLPKGTNIIIDLRSNVGGDLRAAVRSAELFVPSGTLLLTMHERKKEATQFLAASKTPATQGKILVWMDRYTASAAEVFCAALVDSGRAKSVGEQTFGKGVTQRVIPTDTGAYYLLTTGLLVPPSGTSYHKTGLKPNYPVMVTGGDDLAVFTEKTASLFDTSFDTSRTSLAK